MVIIKTTVYLHIRDTLIDRPQVNMVRHRVNMVRHQVNTVHQFRMSYPVAMDRRLHHFHHLPHTDHHHRHTDRHHRLTDLHHRLMDRHLRHMDRHLIRHRLAVITIQDR